MTGPASLFRREALDYHTRQRGPGAVLRIAPQWTGWLYWLTLGLLIAAIGAACLVRVDHTVSRQAAVDPRRATFTALLPVADPTTVPAGRPVRLELQAPAKQQPLGPAGRPLAGWTRHSEAATTTATRAAGLGTVTEPAVLVTGGLPGGPLTAPGTAAASPAQVRLDARAVVVIGSDRVVDLVAQQLLGHGGGP